MSLVDSRAAIAAAADTVAGITAAPYFVQDVYPGRVWVQLDHVEYPNQFGGVAFWNVVLVLPQDQALAEAYLDTTMPLLRAAIDPELVVTTVTPQRIQIDGIGVVPTVFITGHREED